ncbi:MAG: ribosome-associated translation inhibitor RaiA [Clostridia bacterium]|nr:ribosome-associated translation inhibitor RaiA [Clostridia bacterium]
MRIEIVSKNYKPRENMKELLEKKISKFDKYFRKEAVAKVRLSMSGPEKHTMEITLGTEDVTVRSEVTGENMFDNIDIILPKIERQIVKYRKKFDNKLRKEAFEAPSIYESNEGYNEEATGKVVRVKNFQIALTTVENAIQEMELLEHNFFVFVNAETKKVNVVYKRTDGDFGLISPEY